MRLVSPYLNMGRNVTTDNFFTSASLAWTLKAKDTSIVGTISRTRREIPAVLAMERAPLHETTAKNGYGATLTVYQGKVNKNVLLLSTLHSTIDTGTNRKKVPETVQFYNKTKCGVDILDQMARRYSTRAAARRWPVHVFYNILDLAVINAWVIYRGVTGKKRAGVPFSVSLLRNYGRYTERNVNLWFQNTMKKSSRRTKEKQAKGISVK